MEKLCRYIFFLRTTTNARTTFLKKASEIGRRKEEENEKEKENKHKTAKESKYQDDCHSTRPTSQVVVMEGDSGQRTDRTLCSGGM